MELIHSRLVFSAAFSVDAMPRHGDRSRHSDIRHDRTASAHLAIKMDWPDGAMRMRYTRKCCFFTRVAAVVAMRRMDARMDFRISRLRLSAESRRIDRR